MTNKELHEKLVELLDETFDKQYEKNLVISARNTAAFLIANGVTFAKDTDVPAKWISVKERLPKSEKDVLVSVVSKQFGYRRTLMAAHIGHHEATTEDWREYEGDTEYDEENDCFWIPECWWESNAIEDNGNWIIDGEYDVTHWMPLPSLPKEENE